MRFQRLRLSGFKSFVEQTELAIEPGTTGIVGPNGCGKSNLVEALRWVMGESSAKQMRGEEMDDVIFGGTAARPPRRVAEVVLSIDNSARRAPAAFNDQAELEISRRIEREHGSIYRVNGREARARDVQLLFADAATGARSTALVSQGQIGAFIAARPEQRRMVIEEAAGIGGLHARRHEAELRLRAAESNLDRLEDVLGTLDAQLQTLRKQARQASRYRNLSEHIRRAEAELLQARWAQARRALEEAESLFAAMQARVVEATRVAAAASAAQAELAASAPPAREAEARAAAAVQRIAVARDSVAAEERRAEEALRATRTRIAQIERDREQARARAADADAALARLAAEARALTAADEGTADETGALQRDVDGAARRLAECESEAAAVTREHARAEAERSAIAERRRESEARVARLTKERDEIERQRRALDPIRPEALAAAETEIAAAEEALHRAQAEADSSAELLATSRQTELDRRDVLQRAETELAQIRAEATAIDALLAPPESVGGPAVIDGVEVEGGFEAALGAALEDDLGAGVDPGASRRWRPLPALEPQPLLPEGVEPLSAHVREAGTLQRRLGQIGVVADSAIAEAVQPALRPGQRVVTPKGGCWRWDGFVVAAGAQTDAARRLEQRNRLAALRRSLPALETRYGEARERLAAARELVQQAAERERNAREAMRRQQSDLDRRRQARAELARRAAIHESRLAAVAAAAARITSDIADAQSVCEAARVAEATLPDATALRAELDRRRAAAVEARNLLVAARSAFERAERVAEERRRRIAAITSETASWRSRAAEAASQCADLEERHARERAERDRLAALPAEIAEHRHNLVEELDRAEARRRVAADRLAEVEAALATGERRLRSAESAQAEAREERIRAEARVDQARIACAAISERALERLDVAADALADLTRHEDDANADVAALEARLHRLQRERETMGPVNLRAESEAALVEAQMATLSGEREDVSAAIAKLRRGIAELNREGRERLLAAFEQVNRHFEELFVRLFGGGRAHLALTEAEDPLDAGLEIMASPPGKRLQSLLLLSGGERALTALALLFAVFLTNPAPICVLDEVDAPLDDANVDRFCTLVEEIAHASETRFLLVTHHRLTMARMDRLYGVTMAERGVSQLVSVDLRRAEALRATA